MLLDSLKYKFSNDYDEYEAPKVIRDSLTIISSYFTNNENNKLCLIFPNKEYIAQWLTIPLTLENIKNNFILHNQEIFSSYKNYNKGDKLILNNKAIVEFIRVTDKGLEFKTKGVKESSGASMTLKFSQVTKLRKCPDENRKLSSLKTVTETINKRELTPIEYLLKIETFGNTEFNKDGICLVSRYIDFDKSIDDILINHVSINDYIDQKKIDEKGETESNSTLYLTNSLLNLYLLLNKSNQISNIIFDGCFSIIDRGNTDFIDIDSKKIPTILITDLSEIENFGNLKNLGFDFYNFNTENLTNIEPSDNSPFSNLEKRINTFLSFSFNVINIHDSNMNQMVELINSIERDESNLTLINLRIALIQIFNFISRIAYELNRDEILTIQQKIKNIEEQYIENKNWIGESADIIKNCIIKLESIVNSFYSTQNEKNKKLIDLINNNSYDYIICSSEDEALTLSNYIKIKFNESYIKVISISDVNDKFITYGDKKALLIGWSKYTYINRLISGFLIKNVTALFYDFENYYFKSLQNRNKLALENAKSNVDSSGKLNGKISKINFFDNLNKNNSSIIPNNNFDITTYEENIDLDYYSKYIVKSNTIESVKVRKIEFENNYFMFATDSHKFLVINEILEESSDKAKITRIKTESIMPGFIVAQINTDRDILVELVEKNNDAKEFQLVKSYTSLWRNLLKNYFISIGSDFKKLVQELRNCHCDKHEVTIRTWLQDETKIGPEDNSDLISIALLTGSDKLNDNLELVRTSIRKMTGWRMKASDIIMEKIKNEIQSKVTNSLINKIVNIDGLGTVRVLKVKYVSQTTDFVDAKFVNKLLQKENY